MTDLDHTILLIDDADPLRQGIADLLTRSGYHVLQASDGQEGLGIALSQPIDIIICDIMMPELDGFGLRHVLSHEPDLQDIPFIFLTARSNRQDRIEGLRAGADDYITKPFDGEELVLRVERLLSRVSRSRRRGRLEAERRTRSLKAEIVRNFSHEIRTPLTEVLGVLELVLEDKFDDSSAREKFVGSALTSARDLQYLIEDLILLTQIDQGQVSTYRHPIDLRLDFFGPIKRQEERYEAKGHQVMVEVDDEDTDIFAPRREFKQIIRHLVDNALKFSPTQSLVEITLAANGPGGCVLTVRDEGPGIPPDRLQQVFERFYQTSQGATRTFGGLGVGLFIVRTLAREWGGDACILPSATGCQIQMTLPPLSTDSNRQQSK